MRIAYLLHWNGGEESGVGKKVLTQVREWGRQGAEGRLFQVLRAASPGLGEAEASRYSGRWGIPSAWRRACAAVQRWRPDVVYFRYSTPPPAVVRLASQMRLVVEVNSDDLAEQVTASLASRVANRVLRRRLLPRCTGGVFVSHELADHPSFAGLAGQRVTIGNGIDLDATRLLPPAPVDGPPRLVFLGSTGQAWHGVDAILRLAAESSDMKFEIIGPEAGDNAAASSNVRFHGHLPRAKYEPLMAATDVGLGSLAHNRIGLTEASPLKTREYLASGLPVVVGYKDTDFLNGAPFLFPLPWCERWNPEELEGFRGFVRDWRGRRVRREEIAHLAASVKEAARVEFFRRIDSGAA